MKAINTILTAVTLLILAAGALILFAGIFKGIEYLLTHSAVENITSICFFFGVQIIAALIYLINKLLNPNK